MSRLLVLRHAQSVWNASGLFQGWSDAPLSELGERQAGNAGRALARRGVSPGIVACSDLARARRTAELIASETGYEGEMLVDSGLREQDLGDWNGLTRPEIEASWPNQLAERDRGRLLDVPGGEDGAVFADRSLAAVLRVAGACLAAGAEEAVAVSHGGVIVVLERALLLGAEGRRHPNLSGWWVEVSGTPAEPEMAPLEPFEMLAYGMETVTGPA
jgi:glucosyl-3-phosphoglycerate phosphatase